MAKPLLHMVFGGEVEDPQGTDFVDPDKLDILGIYPDHKSALQAWRGASHACTGFWIPTTRGNFTNGPATANKRPRGRP